MGGSIPRVLLVEDDVRFARPIEDTLSGLAIVVWVTTVPEAEGIIDSLWSTFDLVLLDACVPGHQPTTLRLPKLLRDLGYSKTIVGFSSEQEFLLALKGAGCDQVVSKHEIIKTIMRLLRIDSTPPTGK